MQNKKNNAAIAFFYVVLAVFPMLQVVGQTRPVEVLPVADVEHVDGEPFFIHPVSQGQTLFSISRAYGVGQELIMVANPDVAEGLRYGRTIRIPAFSHTVEPRETSFGLSRKYGITLQQLHAFNPDILVEGLRIGMVLYIPGRKPGDQEQLIPAREIALEQPTQDSPPTTTPEEQADPEPSQPRRLIKWPSARVQPDTTERHPDYVSPCPPAALKKTYHVALLIPLYLDELRSPFITDTVYAGSDAQVDLRHKSFSFLPYYHGVLLALDSIRDQGIDIRLHVFDVDQQESKARQAVASQGFINMDLIIGPFFSKTLNYVANFAFHHNIPVVSPLLPDQEQLRNMPNLFNATPSLDSQLNKLAGFMGRNYGQENIIFVHNNQPQALTIINNFKKNLGTVLSSTDAADTLSIDPDGSLAAAHSYVPEGPIPQGFKEVVYIREGMQGLRSKMVRDKENIIITLVGGEAFLSNYLRELNMHTRQYRMKIFGIPDWQDYQSIELDYLLNLKVHIFTSDFQDYNSEYVQNFVSRYRTEFKTEPSSYAFRAVETAYYFFKALGYYGSNFYECMDQLNALDDRSPFRFNRPLGKSSGWENDHFTLFRYEDFQMIITSNQ